jgi:IclR family mhp operon transcriptional activator
MSDSQKDVRSLARGLEILNELNRAGSARAGIIAQRVGLARPTVYRLLETLEESGFVAKSASDERYRITRRTAQIFRRYQTSDLISGPARAAFHDAGQRCPWLLHLATFKNGAMIIRLASRSMIPLLPWRGYIGRLLPLLCSTAGKVYLASCNDQQRQEIFSCLQRAGDLSSVRNQIDCVIDETSSLGYAASDGSPADPLVASISIALTHGGASIGSLTAVYARSAPNDERTKTQLLKFLRSEAKWIERHICQSKCTSG